ncbi:hypothetical protein, partial [Burkholderia gladioli]|uniref:hypothetical protein n=1 Tax=Burkholderia gladioli TaxID=28095 RepID=UPI0034DB3DE4
RESLCLFEYSESLILYANNSHSDDFLARRFRIDPSGEIEGRISNRYILENTTKLSGRDEIPCRSRILIEQFRAGSPPAT